MVEHLEERGWAYGVAARAQAIRAGVRAVVALGAVARDLGFDPDELRAGATS